MLLRLKNTLLFFLVMWVISCSDLENRKMFLKCIILFIILLLEIRTVCNVNRRARKTKLGFSQTCMRNVSGVVHRLEPCGLNWCALAGLTHTLLHDYLKEQAPRPCSSPNTHVGGCQLTQRQRQRECHHVLAVMGDGAACLA